MKKIQKFIRDGNIELLVYTPIFSGLALLFLFFFVFFKIFGENGGNAGIFYIFLGITEFIMSFGAIVQIIRREMPWMMNRTIHGVWPVFTGIVGVVFLWGTGLYLIISAILKWVIPLH
jgi:hypothetical protein